MSERDAAPLRLFDDPLPGMHAVEASAGTGKTYNITGLYLRLLLATDLTPERILVVTYTVAATAELRTRIRSTLLQALEAFHERKDPAGARQTAEDPLLRDLVERFPDAERAFRRLGNALRTFDEAAIFTIHGFCQRVLSENAFESGAALTSEMLGDQSELLAQCVEDFWRRETYEGSALWIRYVLDQSLDPEALRGEMASLIGKPFHEPFYVPEVSDTTDDERRYAEHFEEARRHWKAERDVIAALLQAPGLSRSRYRAPWVASWCDLMDLTLAGTTPAIHLYERFTRFTPDELRAGTKKNGETPTHPFFETCAAIAGLQARLEPAYARRLGLMRAKLLAYCNDEIRRRKEEQRVRWFDDLLIDLERALASPATGPALALALRERYGAALIDEFQDTDPLQYSIFNRIYSGSEAPVFLVGDPKQAIYAFRGADVFAYLQARKDANDHSTLDENHRSDRGVVEGVNAVFGASERPFVFEDIPFHPVRPAHPDRAGEFRETTGLPPVRAWFLPRDDEGKPLKSADAKDWIAETTAAEIARLLESGGRLPQRDGSSVTIHGGHIAVLVRSHSQGLLVRRALSARGIAAVEESQESVFGSSEAEEMERILAAIAEPDDERLVRGALSTTLLGVTAERLVELSDSEQEWDGETASFHEHRRQWLGAGFGQMFRHLLRERNVPERLLKAPEGERRLTNLLQIGELLTSEATTEHSGSETLLQWLATRRRVAAGGGVSPVEHLLRLESDDELVQINTLHGSKGLEYPIVFVPFAWSTPATDAHPPFVTFHQPDSGSGLPYIDFGSDRREEFQRLAEWEALAEDLRLFYVALTRAKHHCTFGWGAVRGANCAAPAWLFHAESARGGEGADPLTLPYHEQSDTELLTALHRVAADSGGALGVESLTRPTRELPRRVSLPVRGPTGPLTARSIERSVRNHWSITSFSALRGGRSVDLADRDARVLASPGQAEPGRDLFGFPRGARAGVCLHRLFEDWDFTEADPQRLRRLVEATLRDFGFPGFWIPTIEKMMRDVLDTWLDADATVRLADVTMDRRLNEIEFHYPAGRLTLDGLNEVLQAHDYPEVPDRGPEDELPRPLVEGYVKGYVDLVLESGGRYYLADYKSNWLGSSLEAYRPDALAAAVRHELYTLQYVTYTLALHRFLRLRLVGYDYDRDMGGAFYLFLRGIRPERGASSGVFFDRPPRSLIEELDERIGRGPVRGAGGTS